MRSKIILFGLLAGLFCFAPSTVFSQDIKFGVLSTRGAAQALKEWKATADYLSAKTGKPFTVVPLEYDQVPAWTKDKKIDFFYTSSAMYVELNKLYGARAVATQVAQFNSQPLNTYGGTILVKKDSPIEKLSDLKGKDVACSSKAAFGGWLMVSRLLIENGIDPNKDIKSVREVKTFDNTVYAVQNGAVPVGFLRTGIVEKMAAEGKVKLADFKVIQQVTDDFPLPHSTKLYPESPIAACQHVPAELRNQVSKALVAIQPTDAAAIDFKILGWTEPLDYKPVVECLTVIKYGAFKDAALEAPAPAAASAAPVTVAAEEKQAGISMAQQPVPDSGQTRVQPRTQKGRTSVP